jgi:hypothetical protein
MLVLRFKYHGERGWKVPPNVYIAGVEIPIGLASVCLVLLTTAIMNLFTKSVATVSGVIFSAVFFLIFTVSEKVNRRKFKAAELQMKEQFQLVQEETVDRETVRIRPNNVLVTVRDYNTLNHRIRHGFVRPGHGADLQRLRANAVHSRRRHRRKVWQAYLAAGCART